MYEKWGKSSIRKDHLDAIRSWEKLRRKETLSGEEFGSVLRHISSFKNRLKEVAESEEISHDEAVRGFGLPTTRIWHEVLDAIPLQDRTYIVAALRRKEKITQTPRIRLSTIHGAKGGEADKVVLFLDVADRSYQYMKDGGIEDEARVFYVGATRARQELHIVRPKTRKFFSIPR
jgi:superfamily I DNA/RNA helicase